MARLATRAAMQSAPLPILLGALAFAGAGTLAYWRSWAQLAVVTAAIAVIEIYLLARDPALLERRLAAGTTGEPTRLQRIVVSIAGPAFLALYLVAGLDARHGWSRVPAAASLAADVALAAGFAIVLAVFRANTFTSSVVEVAAEQRVVTGGPYRIVRHPMYAGALLVIAATPVALGSWWALAGVPVLVAAIAVRLVDEERVLAAQLAGYAEYRRATRFRLIPYVW